MRNSRLRITALASGTGAFLAGIAVAAVLTGPAVSKSPPSLCQKNPRNPHCSSSTTTPSGSGPCGTRTGGTYTHVVVIVMENHSLSSIIGSSAAPYINSLAKKCGLATGYYAITHPSLPNYISMTSGTTAGITDDKSPAAHQLTNASIFSQLGSAWRSYS